MTIKQDVFTPFWKIWLPKWLNTQGLAFGYWQTWNKTKFLDSLYKRNCTENPETDRCEGQRDMWIITLNVLMYDEHWRMVREC